MPSDLATLAQSIAQSIANSLKAEGGQIAALARAEGEALAQGLARIGGLLLRGEVSGAEAELLIRIQRDASEAVLASLAEVSRLTAGRAVGTALDLAVAKISGLSGQSGLIGLARAIAR